MSLVPDSRSVGPVRFYKTTLAGLTYREIWRHSSWGKALLVSVMKKCGYDILLAQGAPEPVRLEQMRLNPFALRNDLRTSLDGLVSHVSWLGFGQPVYYWMPDSLIAGNEGAAAVCIHKDHQTFANLIVVQAGNKRKAVISFVTGYVDGSFFSSGNDKAQLLTNPANGALHLPGSPASELFTQHENARQRWANGRAVRRVSTEAELADALFNYERSGHQWHVMRGAYVEMSPGEIESARRQRASANAPVESGLSDLAELGFRLDFTGEEAASKGAERVSFAASVMVESGSTETSAASTWLLHFPNAEGDAVLEMTIHGLLLQATEGDVLKANLRRGSGSIGGPLLKNLAQILGQQVHGYTPSVKQMNVRLTLLSRAPASGVTETKYAGEHVFQLEFPGTSGAFRFVFHPARCEGQLKPQPDLDRPAALRFLTGLLN
jgi:hypothetical protein